MDRPRVGVEGWNLCSRARLLGKTKGPLSMGTGTLEIQPQGIYLGARTLEMIFYFNLSTTTPWGGTIVL